LTVNSLAAEQRLQLLKTENEKLANRPTSVVSQSDIGAGDVDLF